MTTIERFFFDFESASTVVTVGANGVDYHLALTGTDEDPLSIQITVRGKEDFKKLIKQISEMAEGICED
jgi:hypothetical protein